MTDPEIIDALGGTNAVAVLCEIKPPSVSEWRRNGIPHGRRLLLKALRPDLFADAAAAAAVPVAAADAAAIAAVPPNSTGPIKPVPAWGQPLHALVSAMVAEQADHAARHAELNGRQA